MNNRTAERCGVHRSEVAAVIHRAHKAFMCSVYYSHVAILPACLPTGRQVIPALGGYSCE
jgi:hypothetical protein